MANIGMQENGIQTKRTTIEIESERASEGVNVFVNKTVCSDVLRLYTNDKRIKTLQSSHVRVNPKTNVCVCVCTNLCKRNQRQSQASDDASVELFNICTYYVRVCIIDTQNRHTNEMN